MIYSCLYPTDDDNTQLFYCHITTSMPSIPAFITTTNATHKHYLNAHVSLEPTTIKAAHVDSHNATSPNYVNSHPTTSTPTQLCQLLLLQLPPNCINSHHLKTHPCPLPPCQNPPTLWHWPATLTLMLTSCVDLCIDQPCWWAVLTSHWEVWCESDWRDNKHKTHTQGSKNEWHDLLKISVKDTN